jgi:hypothetical protein
MRLTRHPARFPLALIGLTLAAINRAAVTGSINDDNPEARRQFQAAANDVVTIIMKGTGSADSVTSGSYHLTLNRQESQFLLGTIGEQEKEG